MIFGVINDCITQLLNFTGNSEKNVSNLNLLYKEYELIGEEYGRKLQILGEKFNEECKKMFGQKQVKELLENLGYYLQQIGSKKRDFIQKFKEENLDLLQVQINSYKEINKQINQSMKDDLKQMQLQKQNLEKLKENYIIQCTNAEKTSQKLEKLFNQSQLSKNDQLEIQKLSEKQIQQKIQAEELMTKNKQEVLSFNENWSKYKIKFQNYFVEYDQNEDNKFKFILKSLQKFYSNENEVQKHVVQIKEIFQKEFELMEEDFFKIKFKHINLNSKTNELIDEYKETFQKFEQLKQNDGKNVQIITNGQELIEKRNLDILITNILDPKLNIKNPIRRKSQKGNENLKQLDPTQTLDHESILEKKELRTYFLDKFCEELSKSNGNVYEFQNQNYILIEEILSIIIYQMEIQNDYESEDFYSVVQLCLQIYNEGRQERIFNKIQDRALEELNLILIDMELQSDFPAEIVVQIGKKQNIKSELIFQLLDKLETTKNISNYQKKIQDYKLIQQHKLRKFFQIQSEFKSKAIYCIKKALKYLSVQDRPINLLLTNKYFFQNIRPQILYFYSKQNEKVINKYRTNLWLYILNANPKNNKSTNYPLMKTEVALQQENVHHQDDQIAMDVNRSLHIHSQKISSQMLQGLLRTYSVSNPETNYCQGMNYLAGFLYLKIEDEEKTYLAFQNLMKNWMSQIFVDGFSNLKKMIFVFNRLVQIFLPNLAHHFKQEKIDINFFITSWFITIFTQCFQFTEYSFLLDQVWDLFLTQKWVGFYKAALYVLNIQEKKLLTLEFDKILVLLSDSLRQELFSYNQQQFTDKTQISVQDVKKQITSIKISSRIIEQLESDYENFKIKIQERLN